MVALAGPSGAGKSTLARVWSRYRPDAEVFADDALALERGAEGFAARRIEEGPESAGADLPPHAPLAAILLLARSDRESAAGAPAIVRVAAGEAFAALLGEAFCAALEPLTLRRLAAAYLELLSRVPVRRLRYASGGDRLPEVVATLAGFTPRAR